MMNPMRWRLVLTALIPALAVQAPSFAAPTREHLNNEVLIEGLAREGMGELIEHLAATEPSSDPVIRKHLEIARLRVRYTDPNLPREEQAAAFDQMLDAMRALITEHNDHEHRPLWQTDLAEWLLFENLQVVHEYAAAFYEFGVTTPEQEEAFEAAVTEALVHLSAAERRLTTLQTELPRDPDHDEKRVYTGLWDRMMKQYFKGKTPFYLARAAYYTALLDNDHPYFNNLGNPEMPRQRDTPELERKRLIELAGQRLAPFVSESGDPYGIQAAARCLAGRVMVLDGSTDIQEAIKTLEGVMASGRIDRETVLARLGKGNALLRSDQHRAALDLVESFALDPVLGDHALFRLLTLDMAHRMRLAQAQSGPETGRSQAIGEAYTLYEQFLTDPALGDQALSLKSYIYRRWAARVGEEEAAAPDTPSVVMRAVGEITRMQGQNLAIEAGQLEADGQDALALQRREEALPTLDRSIRINRLLLERDSLSPQTRAEAMHNLAMSTYFRAATDVAAQLEATAIWLDLAENLPDQPVAEQAITFAVSLLGQLAAVVPPPESVPAAYERAGRVLFEKFPTIEAADNERVYYAYQVLAKSDRFGEAVDVLEGVPPTHEDYFIAQREVLFNLKKVMDASTKVSDIATAQSRLEQAANRVREAVADAPPDLIAEQSERIHNTDGWANLMLVDVAIAQGDTEAAVGRLKEFDSQFGDDEELQRESLSRGIAAKAQVGQYREAVTAAQRMMQAFPDNASWVIDQVLSDLQKRARQLRQMASETLVQSEKDQLLTQAQGISRTAVDLSQLLLDWAITQGYNEDEMLPYRLSLADAMRLSGNTDQAMKWLQPLVASYGDNASVMHAMGECLYAAGDDESLIKAANQYYDVLIAALETEDHPDLRRIWWNAWMRRLQISDALGDGADEIPLRVRQLAMMYPDLGGEPFRSELNRLAVKHRR